MIVVTRLDRQLMYLNPDHIICIEETPDTVITLFNGNRYIVKDRAKVVVERVVAFRAAISRRASRPSGRKCRGRLSNPQQDWLCNMQNDSSGQSPSQEVTLFHSRDY